MKKKLLPKSLVLAVTKCAFLFAAVISANSAAAQHNTGTPKYAYYTNSVFTFKAPFYNDTLFERAQMLYRPADLTTLTAGNTPAPSGTITKVYFRAKPGTTGVFNMTDVIIKMTQTADTQFNGPTPTTPDIPFYTCKEVFKQATYKVSEPGWIEFALSTPFAYDKNKSLIVEFSGNDGFYGCTQNSNRQGIMGKLNSTTGYYVPFLHEFGFDFGTTGISETATENQANLYPNPATDRVQLLLTESTGGNILVTDLNGRTMLQESFTGKTHSFSISSLASGLYFYKIFNTDKMLIGTGKLAIAH